MQSAVMEAILIKYQITFIIFPLILMNYVYIYLNVKYKYGVNSDTVPNYLNYI